MARRSGGRSDNAGNASAAAIGWRARPRGQRRHAPAARRPSPAARVAPRPAGSPSRDHTRAPARSPHSPDGECDTRGDRKPTGTHRHELHSPAEKLSESIPFARTIAGMKRTILTALVAVSLLAAIGSSAEGDRGRLQPQVRPRRRHRRSDRPVRQVVDRADQRARLRPRVLGLRRQQPLLRQRTCPRYGYNNGTFNMDYLWQSNIVRGQAQLDWHVGAGGRAIWAATATATASRWSRARADRASI